MLREARSQNREVHRAFRLKESPRRSTSLSAP
jgi:hypothetical protein